MSAEQLLRIHREHLERQRHAMNLIGPGDASFHYDDCVAAVRWLASHGLADSGHWADLGSGAGFPGIILAAEHPGLHVDLVESRRKRCVFLEQVVLEAQISRVRVCRQRVEDLAPGSYDGIVARAFAPPPEVLRIASRLLRPAGVVVLFLQDAAEVVVPEGFRHLHTESYTVHDRRRRAVGLRRDAHAPQSTGP